MNNNLLTEGTLTVLEEHVESMEMVIPIAVEVLPVVIMYVVIGIKNYKPLARRSLL